MTPCSQCGKHDATNDIIRSDDGPVEWVCDDCYDRLQTWTVSDLENGKSGPPGGGRTADGA